MPTDTEWPLLAFLLALCAIGIVTAGVVANMTAQAVALPL